MADQPKDPKKTVDLPPHGPRNPDPITNQPGSHPVETGIGAAVGGVASGLAVGTLTAGPIGAVIGAIAGGAVAGGLAGKGIGELIDPTTKDNWLRDYFNKNRDEKPATQAGETAETYRPAYDYGVEAGTRHTGRQFDEVESDLRADWEKQAGTSGMGWSKARGAVRDAYDRSGQYHADRQRGG